ncbi:hypothetical protein BDZ88DRAFT_507998 [Geranomyces variabilis]|nr:hypothetical protein BDZ88DRAFT_507998 [Geranomyces variabilis]
MANALDDYAQQCFSRQTLKSDSTQLLLSLLRDSPDPCIAIVRHEEGAAYPGPIKCPIPASRSEDQLQKVPGSTASTQRTGQPRAGEVEVAYANAAASRVFGYGFWRMKQFGPRFLDEIIGGRDSAGAEKQAMVDWLLDRTLYPPNVRENDPPEEKIIYFRCHDQKLIPSNTDVYPMRYQNSDAPGPIIPGLLLRIHPVYPLSNKLTAARSRSSSRISLGSLSDTDFEARLQKVYVGACTAIGHDFFQKVLGSIASWAGFYYSWISVLIPGQPAPDYELKQGLKMRMLGFWRMDKGYMEEHIGAEYDGSDTPCYLTLTDNVVSVPENVRETFPNNPFWKVLNPMPISYIALAIIDTQTGDYLGNIGMMDTQAGLEGLVGSAEHVKIGLRVFAERVGAEIKRMSMEDAIKTAREAAIKANESKSQYLNHLNHELRSPMNAVLGISELLEDTKLCDSQRELVSTLRSSSAHLLSVINNVLDLTKIELGNVTLSKDAVDIAAVLDEVVKIVRPTDVGINTMQRQREGGQQPALDSPRQSQSPMNSQNETRAREDLWSPAANAPVAARKAVEIRWEIVGNVPKLIEGDSGRLRQVIINLVANGYKFCDVGEVVARCRFPDRSGPLPQASNRSAPAAGDSDSEVYLQFEVQDTGPGVPLDKADDLFKPFVQLESTSAKHSQGSGLGLTIAQQLVHLMGGQIWLKQPSPDMVRGTTIAFTIRARAIQTTPPDATASSQKLTSLPPSHETPAKATSAMPSTSESGAKSTWDRTLADRLPLKILLAEDDLLNAKIAKSMFGKFGYTAITHVVNGLEALEKITTADSEGWMFDVLFCDMFMPLMDGYTTATKIREYFATRPPSPSSTVAPRIIALTANASVEDRNKCLALGMCAYMTKPLSIQELYDSLLQTGEARGHGYQGR